ncbi:FecCD family ABC transporter permease [Seleniivibrio woodruffii]|uniref:Iron complex transport system permease protein n=1 Tax=Seleniivibrio woodruffii TaxID=1078050 RepID=A0A4R1K8U9_9BACT|nr:iron ABC transporter permease [Seleniivibrio woodruffii]TCK60754.1 iron complex transport system permease protein [Seleniivibrio woodruffii]TVZ36384.1 iron complex transport system permease protein [Seleniivibrio woodruffii]
MRYLWLLFALIAVAASLFFGSANIDLFDKANSDIILNLRLPRAVFSFMVGAMLGLSGSVYQLVLRNPLADSFTTGAASSSALGAVFAIAAGFSPVYVPPFAFITGILGLFIVYKLSGGAKGAVTMILCGVIVNIVASAIMGFIKFYFDESLSSVVFWLMGGFNFINYTELAIVFCVLTGAFIYLNKRAPVLDMLIFDDSTARTAGVSIKQERAGAFITATILVSVAVSYSGLIGFVGLIVPHIARSIFRPDMRTNLYYSMIFGGFLLLAADTFARSAISSGAELPVGIVTAVIGGVFFFYILVKRRSEMWHD